MTDAAEPPVAGISAPASRPRPGGPPEKSITVAVVILLAAVLAGIVDGRLPRTDPSTHLANVTSPTAPGSPPTLSGWTLTRRNAVLWAAPYFGETSTWSRFSATPNGDVGDDVLIDLIDSPDRHALAAYAVNTYFRGFDVASARLIPLAPGLEGVLLRSFAGRATVAWTRRVGTGSAASFEEVFVTARSGGRSATGEVEDAARSLAERP